MTPSAAELRSVCGRFATGVTVIGARNGRHLHGMTVNSFCSLSLEPPLVLACLQEGSSCSEVVAQAGSFAVSVLSAEQERVAERFADRSLTPEERFEGLDHNEYVTGAPVLDGSLAWLDCELREILPGGDHRIIIGAVVAVGNNSRARPLLFYRGEYGRLPPAVDSFARVVRQHLRP